MHWNTPFTMLRKIIRVKEPLSLCYVPVRVSIWIELPTWGYSKLFYAPDSTAKAARLFTSVADQYKGNNNFEYDLVDIVRQSNADKGNVLLEEISQSYDRKDKEDFRKQTQQFLDLILAQDRLLSTRKEFSVSSWLNAARSLGTTEEEKRLYEWNASALITVWGDSIAANQGGLHDYSHREWSGLLKDLYYQRWKAFFEQKQAELDGKPAGQEIKLLWDGESLGREE